MNKYAKFWLSFLVALFQIAAAYLSNGDYKIAITAVISAVLVILVPNLPQFPWLKTLMIGLGAGATFLFAVDTPTTETFLMAIVAAFAAVGVYGLPNDGADAKGVSAGYTGV